MDALKETLIFLANYLRLNLSWNLDCGDDKMIYNGVYNIGKATKSVHNTGLQYKYKHQIGVLYLR